MSRKITTKEQYDKSLKWLVEKAEHIANMHPLTPEAERVKQNKLYDIVAKEIDRYLTEKHANSDPELKEIYQELGLIEIEYEQLKLDSLPKQEEQTQKKVDLSAWIG